MAYFDPTLSYAAGGMDRETGQNLPSALWQRLMDTINFIGGTTGNNRPDHLSLPNQPAFLTYLSANAANVTGNATAYTIAFDTEVFDQGADLAGSTFTAPVAGRYRLSAHAGVGDLTTAMTRIVIEIVTSNRTYFIRRNISPAAADVETMGISVLADMDAGDTATVRITLDNGAGATADVLGTAAPIQTFFSGELVA